MRLCYKNIDDDVDFTLCVGFQQHKYYDVKNHINIYNNYIICNDYGTSYYFNTQKFSSYYIWNFFYTEKEIRKMKLNNIINNI